MKSVANRQTRSCASVLHLFPLLLTFSLVGCGMSDEQRDAVAVDAAYQECRLEALKVDDAKYWDVYQACTKARTYFDKQKNRHRLITAVDD